VCNGNCDSGKQGNEQYVLENNRMHTSYINYLWFIDILLLLLFTDIL
jgi:hypothetical protein